MEGYNAPKDKGYSVASNYGSINQNVVDSNYGREQVVVSSLPIYQAIQEQPIANRKSRCPRGALLGSIGSCCGMNCTRACAMPG